MSLRVHLKRPAKHLEVDPTALKRFARAVFRGEGITDGVVCLVLTDNERIQKLNAQFRNLDRATDVLAFPVEADPLDFPIADPDAEDADPYLGDVVISVERALEQAPRFHNDPESELARLVVHGILHLLGYDHHAPADGRRMKAAERRALLHFQAGALVPEALA